MKRILFTTAAVLAAATAIPATAAVFPVGTPNFTGTPGPGGTFSGKFGNDGLAEGEFEDIFTFTLPTDGLGSGTVSTSASVFESVNDLDFTEVLVNGIAADITKTEGGLFEVAFKNQVPITAGVLNEITVRGISRGNGAYGGQLAFIPGAIPEPATWAMMIGGFGLVGGAIRRRRSLDTVSA